MNSVIKVCQEAGEQLHPEALEGPCAAALGGVPQIHLSMPRAKQTERDAKRLRSSITAVMYETATGDGLSDT